MFRRVTQSQVCRGERPCPPPPRGKMWHGAQHLACPCGPASFLRQHADYVRLPQTPSSNGQVRARLPQQQVLLETGFCFLLWARRPECLAAVHMVWSMAGEAVGLPGTRRSDPLVVCWRLRIMAMPAPVSPLNGPQGVLSHRRSSWLSQCPVKRTQATDSLVVCFQNLPLIHSSAKHCSISSPPAGLRLPARYLKKFF